MNATTSSAREGARSDFGGELRYGRAPHPRSTGLRAMRHHADSASSWPHSAIGHTTHFSFSKCHPCSRLTLSPIFPVAQPSRGIAVHIAIASDKSQPLIESVRRLPRGPGRKLNSPSAQPNCTTDCLLAQGCAHTTPSDRLVHHHVLDPGPHTCRDSEDDKCEHTDDSPSVPAVSRYQHHAGLGLDNLANQVRCRHGGTSRQLRYQTVEGGDQLVINSVCCCNLNPPGGGRTHRCLANVRVDRTPTSEARRVPASCACGRSGRTRG